MRLVTRSDFDSIVSAALLRELGVVNDIFFTHPKDLQDGRIAVTRNDVLVNVPYVEGCGLWLDHHSSEGERLNLQGRFKGCSKPAPSAARVVYDHYNCSGKPSKFNELMKIDEILALPDIEERVDRYFEYDKQHNEFLQKHSKTDGTIVITDFRGVSDIPPGNRHLVYALSPDCNISIRLIDDKEKRFVVFSVGYSILNRTSKVNVGSLMLKYGGGGHKEAGTCRIPYGDSDRLLNEIIETIKGE